MKYILTKKLFESSLLSLEDNVDYELTSIIENLLPNKGDILEISCGNGADSIYLTNKGYDVTATETCQEYIDYVSKYINCINHDTRNKFPFTDKSFDLIYSRLGLHYFTKEELSKIFSELNRLTKKYLVFTVKIQQDDINTGKIILNESEWEELVSENFNIISSTTKEGTLYNSKSKWLEIVAEII